MVSYITVERPDSDVNCPDCKQRMRKQDFPLHPWPKQIQNAQNMRPFLGQAFCDSCPSGPHQWRWMG